ncbi:MAG: endonuclease/exonuclease/phosphatase family protein [Pseudomonadota bacterium]
MFSVVSVLASELHWFFSLWVHFQIWFFGLSFLLFLFSLKEWRKAPLVFTTVVFSLLFHGLVVVTYLWPNSAPKVRAEGSEQSFKVIFHNLNVANPRKSEVLSYMKNSSRDLLLFVEFNQSWARSLNELRSEYPYAKAIVLENNFGMAAFSRTQLQVDRVYFEKERRIPALFLTTEVQSQSLNIILFHPFPPFGRFGTLLRDQYLSSLSHRVRELKGPTILCGDFNTTPWSSIFKEFLARTQLKLAKSSPHLSTWEPISGLPGLPIDHCLTKGFAGVDLKVGKALGSDHRMLSMRVKFSPL